MDESVVCTVPSPSRATISSLPTEEVTLEVQATSASSGKYCTICKKITLPGNRRTLNPKSAESNRRVVSFLQQYASTALLAEPGPGCYICRSCFSDAEKGDKSLQTALYNINSIRKTLGLPAVTTAVSVVGWRQVTTNLSRVHLAVSPSHHPNHHVGSPKNYILLSTSSYFSVG